MTGADWIWGVAALCEAAGRSLYLLGSDPGASAEAAAALQRWYPSLRITGTHHGYFELGSPHAERVLEHINENQPDILLVGMGTPQQELWVRAALRPDRRDGRLDRRRAVRLRVRAHPRAPHWMSDNGLEWIFRLAVEPRRMWRRYLLGNPVFLAPGARGAEAPALSPRLGTAAAVAAAALLALLLAAAAGVHTVPAADILDTVQAALRASLAAVLLFAVCGFGITRLLLPAHARRVRAPLDARRSAPARRRSR